MIIRKLNLKITPPHQLSAWAAGGLAISIALLSSKSAVLVPYDSWFLVASIVFGALVTPNVSKPDSAPPQS